MSTNTKNKFTEKSVDESWQQWLSFDLNEWQTLIYDFHSFENFSEQDIKIKAFINRILINYINDAWCSISEHKSTYLDIINKYNAKLSEKSKDEIIKLIIQSRDIIKQDKTNEYTRVKIYVQKELRETITDSQNSKYYNNIKSYLEAVIHEYVSLPYSEREKVYFKDLVKKINEAIDRHKTVKFNAKGKSYIVRPYSLETDKSTNYNYLMCSDIESKKDSFISFRLQHIKDLKKIDSDHFTPLSANEKKNLKAVVSRKGAPYVADEGLTESKVLLTAKGYSNYKEWINQRPLAISNVNTENSEHILTFNCSFRQIRNYFFKFGSDAYILEPAELREEFREMYIKAAEKYK